MYCCRKESLPETWLRCFSQRTQSFSLPQHKSSENYFPKVSIVVSTLLNCRTSCEIVTDQTKLLTSSFNSAHFRAKPTNWWSYKHAWSRGEVCGVLEEECQLHTTGQFVKTLIYTVQNTFCAWNVHIRCSFHICQVTNADLIWASWKNQEVLPAMLAAWVFKQCLLHSNQVNTQTVLDFVSSSICTLYLMMNKSSSTPPASSWEAIIFSTPHKAVRCKLQHLNGSLM